MIGETLAHYKILEKIGEGGMGEVYLAEDTKLKRQVALKLLPEAMAGDAERLHRFQREAEAIAAQKRGWHTFSPRPVRTRLRSSSGTSFFPHTTLVLSP